MFVASPQRALYRSKPKTVDPSTAAAIAALRAEVTRQTKLSDRYRTEATNAKKKLHTVTSELAEAQRRIASLEKTLKRKAAK